jgi:hypothetical protein
MELFGSLASQATTYPISEVFGPGAIVIRHIHLALVTTPCPSGSPLRRASAKHNDGTRCDGNADRNDVDRRRPHAPARN